MLNKYFLYFIFNIAHLFINFSPKMLVLIYGLNHNSQLSEITILYNNLNNSTINI